MPHGTFKNKLSDKHDSKFSDAEHIKLVDILRDMSSDIDKVTDIDFNAALGAILKK